MPAATCSNGWLKDPFHSAAGAECRLAATVLNVTLWIGAAGAALCFVGFVYIAHVMLPRHEPWTSPRRMLYSWWGTAFLGVGIAFAQLAHGADAIGDRDAIWRPLLVVGWAVGQFGIGTPLLTYFMWFKPTWES